MKLEVTEKNARLEGEYLAVGQVIEIDAKSTPPHLVNKARKVPEGTKVTLEVATPKRQTKK